MTTKPRIALLDYRYRRRDAWYVDLRAAFDAEWIEGPGIAIGESVRDEIDLAIIRDERGGPEASVAVRELVERHVPTLHLAHGIIEWRNTWEFPNPCAGDDPYPPYFQPILCHKMACFGRAQARLLEAWGNGGKCEIVGFPRLDPY